jgi:hypothetical protein
MWSADRVEPFIFHPGLACSELGVSNSESKTRGQFEIRSTKSETISSQINLKLEKPTGIDSTPFKKWCILDSGFKSVRGSDCVVRISS